MKTLTLTYNKADFQGYGEFLSSEGFDRDQFDNKYKKRIVLWTKDGVDYIVDKAIGDGTVTTLILKEYK